MLYRKPNQFDSHYYFSYNYSICSFHTFDENLHNANNTFYVTNKLFFTSFLTLKRIHIKHVYFTYKRTNKNFPNGYFLSPQIRLNSDTVLKQLTTYHKMQSTAAMKAFCSIVRNKYKKHTKNHKNTERENTLEKHMACRRERKIEEKK